MAAMEAFLSDYEQGGLMVDTWRQNYRRSRSPIGPSTSPCAHTYCSSTVFSSARNFIGTRFELCRVAREVRVFPLLALGGQRSPSITVLRTFANQVTMWSIKSVP